MKINVVGPVKKNSPFGTEIAFVKGFLRLGHDVETIDPNFQGESYHLNPDFTLIFKTGHDYNTMISKLPGPKIVYQPDDLRFPHIQQLMIEMRDVADYALTFDDDGAKEVTKGAYGYKAAQTLLLTADDELYKPMGMQKDLDFIFVGSLGGLQAHASRRRMLQVLGDAGLKVHFGETYDINSIVQHYNRAKVILNHATDVGQLFGTGYGYQCRHFEAGMTKGCLLSNSLINTEPLLGWWAEYSSEENLITSAKMLLEQHDVRHEIGESIYEEIRDRHMPEHRAASVIEFVRNL